MELNCEEGPSPTLPIILSSEPKNTKPSLDTLIKKETSSISPTQEFCSSSNFHDDQSHEEEEDIVINGLCGDDDGVLEKVLEEEEEDQDDVVMISGRERLKRHRREVAGRVWIPEIWGQEELLKDWIDCNAFDDCVVPHDIISARSALVNQQAKATTNPISISSSIRTVNGC